MRADSKPVVGFSDITSIHLALWKHCRLATVHGALAGPTACDSLRRLLMETSPLTVVRNPESLTAVLAVPGRAEGPLIGGNRRELAGWVGAGLPSLAGSIVLLEDLRHAGIGQIDRNLTQLRHSGAFNDVVGIAVGSFEDFAGFVDRGWSVVDVLEDRLCNLGIPALGGFDIGHGVKGPDGGPDQFAVALGATAILDTESGTLTIGPCLR